MKTLITTLLLFFAFSTSVMGQVVSSREDCPTIGIAGPLTAVKDGQTAIFTANVSGKFDEKKVGYKWEVQNAEIASGQGTKEITIKISGKPTVTVNVSGLEEGCNGVVSLTALYGDIKPTPVLFDEFGKVKNKLLGRRIAALLDTLRRNPDSHAEFVSYGTSKDIQDREQAIRKLTSGADPALMVFKNGGTEKGIRTQVWIIPAGADAKKVN